MLEINAETLDVHEVKTNPNFSLAELYQKHDLNEAHKIIYMLTSALGIAVHELKRAKADPELIKELDDFRAKGRLFVL